MPSGKRKLAIWIPVLVALITLIGTLVSSWPKPKQIVESLLSKEECYFLDAKVGQGVYEHVYCFDKSAPNCGIRHKDMNGYANVDLIVAEECNNDVVHFSGRRTTDNYRVEAKFLFTQGSVTFESISNPKGVFELKKVSGFPDQP